MSGVTFGVVTAVNVNIRPKVLKDLTSYSLIDNHQCFGSICFLHFQGRWRQEFPSQGPFVERLKRCVKCEYVSL